MNWVSPIKDDETLKKFKELLRATDDKYYIMFEIGIGTGLQLQDILKFTNKDIRGKDSIIATIGTKNIQRTFNIPSELKEIILNFTEGKSPDAYLITGHASSSAPLSREQAYRVFKSVGKSMGLTSIGAQTMRKTFAWRYFKATNDIYYLQNLLNHASPSITYRYIGEKPNVQVVLKKLTPEENERSRYTLYTNDNGKKRIHAIKDVLNTIESELDNPTNNDSFYGRVECLIIELEELMDNFKNTNP
jgi:integrase